MVSEFCIECSDRLKGECASDWSRLHLPNFISLYHCSKQLDLVFPDECKRSEGNMKEIGAVFAQALSTVTKVIIVVMVIVLAIVTVISSRKVYY